MIKAAVIGANGYGGIELVRLLLTHPEVELCYAVSRSDKGELIRAVFPHINTGDMTFCDVDDIDLSLIDVCFFATPHGVAMKQASRMIENGIKVIDLSADFRIKDACLWSEWYGMPHSEEALLQTAVYGLPETQRDMIKDAKLIACPGCYPTSIQLGLLPILKESLSWINPIIIDAKSGVSGAGRKASTRMLFTERDADFEAYAASGHRHLPEIESQLSLLANKDVSVIFTPHLIPVKRGIFSSIYVQLTEAITLEDIHAMYQQTFMNEIFVSVLPLGQLPAIKNVVGSNYVQIGLAMQKSNVLSIFVVEDNLLKGASGQAVQCLNLMFGLEESLGLSQTSIA